MLPAGREEIYSVETTFPTGLSPVLEHYIEIPSNRALSPIPSKAWPKRIQVRSFNGERYDYIDRIYLEMLIPGQAPREIAYREQLQGQGIAETLGLNPSGTCGDDNLGMAVAALLGQEFTFRIRYRVVNQAVTNIRSRLEVVFHVAN